MTQKTVLKTKSATKKPISKQISKFDEKIRQWCRDSNEKIPFATLTWAEQQLLDKIIADKGISESDYLGVAIRQKLAEEVGITFHDMRRPLPI